MIVVEDYAKGLVARRGLQTPRGRTARTVDEAISIARELGGPVVIKALIPAGRRGKAGGIQKCSSIDQVREAVCSLLGCRLLGNLVERVLVEEMIPVKQEIYAGVIANAAMDKIDLIVSFAGGVDVEQQVQYDDGTVLRLAVEPGDVLPVHRVRKWLLQADIDRVNTVDLADVLIKMYRAAVDLDAVLLEINPLAICDDGSILCLDCKLEIDDNSLPRQPELAELYRSSLSEPEMRARELGVSYVPLDGDIGVIASGAGLGMMTLDLLKQNGLSAANFLDTGGGISQAMVKGALELIMEPPHVRGAIINLYGGINRMIEAAQGILAAIENVEAQRPIVVKIVGNQQQEAWELLEPEHSVNVVRVVQTEDAVVKLARLLG